MRKFTCLSAIVVASGLAACADSGDSTSGIACSEFRFDPKAWVVYTDRAGSDGLTKRQRIADELLRCRVLVGRSKRQVREMLGSPVPFESNPRVWIYNTGPERSPIKLDPEQLRLRFGPGGRVREVKLSAY